MTNIKNEILEFVKSNSYLDEGDHDDDALRFETRRHGNMSVDEPGEADLFEAENIGNIVKKKYPNTTISVEAVDEWTMLRIEIKK